MQNAISKGVMSTETVINDEPYYQLGISVNPGNSGGPVFDSAGDVVGVVTLKATKQEGLAFCIPLALLQGTILHVDEQTPHDIEVGESRHRVRVAFRGVNTNAIACAHVMRVYTAAMGEAIDKSLSASDGLKIAKETMQTDVANLKDNDLLPKSEVISKICVDPNLPEPVRQKFVDLWANYRELRGYVDDPRGSYTSYRAKHAELSDNHNRLSESLRLLLGLPELDD